MNITKFFNENPRLAGVILVFSLFFIIFIRNGLIIYILFILFIYIARLIKEEYDNLTQVPQSKGGGFYAEANAWFNGWLILENSLWMDESISEDLDTFIEFMLERNKNAAEVNAKLDEIEKEIEESNEEIQKINKDIAEIKSLLQTRNDAELKQDLEELKAKKKKIIEEEKEKREIKLERKPKKFFTIFTEQFDAITAVYNNSADGSPESQAAALAISRIESMQKNGTILFIPKAPNPPAPESVKVYEFKDEKEEIEEKPKKEEKANNDILAEVNKQQDELDKTIAEFLGDEVEEEEEKVHTSKHKPNSPTTVNVVVQPAPPPKPPATPKNVFLHAITYFATHTRHPINYLSVDPEIRIRLREFLAKNSATINFLNPDEMKNIAEYMNRFKLFIIESKKPAPPPKKKINFNFKIDLSKPKEKITKPIKNSKEIAAFIIDQLTKDSGK